jgi:hypothetical protein
MKVVALAALLTGCVASSHEAPVPGPREGVLGSPEDVHTAAGDYVGYRVVRPCAPESAALADLGVSGTGSVILTQAMITAAGTEILKLIGDLRLPGGGGYGFACEAGFGTTLVLGDWRDVDTAIARVGPWIAERNLALQVAISVEVFNAF